MLNLIVDLYVFMPLSSTKWAARGIMSSSHPSIR